MMAMTPELQRALAGLNTAQREAVQHQDSPLLILAGAGSGKTRVITVKIAWLVDELGVDPRSILAVTFTNKAAGEMRERAAALVDRAAEVTIRTFHSFGAWMLRRNADAAGLPRGFSIYDEDDSITLLRAIYPEQKRTVLARYAHLISRAKDYCLTPEDDLTAISHDPELPDIYRAYQTRLKEIGNADFGDLIMRPVQLLETDRIVRERMQARFRYLLVDEYQDSNVAQYRMLTALAASDSFVCVVGDDDQSIYRFRGAEVQNILTFPDSFPGTRIVRLEQNYRSTEPILDLAAAVVAKNEGRLGKTLFTDLEGGERPVLALLGDQDDEVDYVVDRVRRAERAGEEGITAVLYRTNAQSRIFETALLREGIPYRIVGSVRFYEREEIRDAVSFLKFLSNPRDEVGFRRIVNKPARGIGAKSVDRIMENLPHARGDLRLAAEYAIRDLPKKAAAGLESFLGVCRRLAAQLGPGTGAAEGATVGVDTPPEDGATAAGAAEGAAAAGGEPRPTAPGSPGAPANLGEFVDELLTASGLATYHAEEDEISAGGKLQNLDELVNAASLYAATTEGLTEFLEAIELDASREQESSEDARVVLITMHNTKGLEFDRVIITGLEDGLFPRDDDPDELEEERRLFYVAVTRAKRELHLTSCRGRRLHGRYQEMVPSRFLGEIPEELVTLEGGYGGGRGAGFGVHDPWGDPDDEEHPLPRGTAVYHEDYGSGVVTRAWFSGSEPVVLVGFETGMTGQFLPNYTPLEQIAGYDD